MTEQEGAHGERLGRGSIPQRHGAAGFAKKNQIVVKHQSTVQRSGPPNGGGDGQSLDPSTVVYSLLGSNYQESRNHDPNRPSWQLNQDNSQEIYSVPLNGSVQTQRRGLKSGGELKAGGESPTSQRINAIKDSAERIRSTLQKHSKDHEEARRILSRPSTAASGTPSEACIVAKLSSIPCAIFSSPPPTQICLAP